MVVSALIGQPPLTPDDYFIVRGLLLNAGLVNVDPGKGLHLPPFRPPPNQYHFQTRGPAILAVCSVLIVVMLSATVGRLLVRHFKKGPSPGLDDWLIIPALILALLWPILQICMIRLAGGGKHLYDITYHELYLFHWFGAFAKMDFYVALGFVKLSITSFNMRLTGLSSRKWMYAHWTFFGILTVYILCAILLVTFHCNPVSAGFNTIDTGKLSVPPKCLSEPTVNDPLSFWHVEMDFCLLAVPILVLWKVLIPRVTKIRLYLLLSVGAISCFASVMRQIAQRHLKVDPTYNYTALLYWSLIDITTGILVASLPVLSSVVPGWALAGWKPSKPSGRSSSYGRSKPKNPEPVDLHSKHSREGIIRQDDVELQFRDRDLGSLEEGTTIDLRPSAYQAKARNCDRTSHPRTSQHHSYLCPGIGGATSVLLYEQWPTPSLILTTPHCTGSTAAFSSPSGGWHAALMAPLQVATSGMPAGYFLHPVAPVARTIKVPTTIVNMIAPDE